MLGSQHCLYTFKGHLALLKQDRMERLAKEAEALRLRMEEEEVGVASLGRVCAEIFAESAQGRGTEKKRRYGKTPEGSARRCVSFR